MPRCRHTAPVVLATAALLALTSCAAGGTAEPTRPTISAGPTGSASPASSASPTGSAGSASPTGPATRTSPATSAGRLSAPITVDRSGGFAGIGEHIVLQPSGEWAATGPRATSRTGQLSPDRLASMRKLTEGTTWWSESRRAATPGPCPDGYVYVVTIGDRRATANDCSLSTQPNMRAIVTLLTDATRA